MLVIKLSVQCEVPYSSNVMFCCSDGEWTKCDEVYVGLKGQRDFMESTHFLIDTAAPLSLLVRLVIKIDGQHLVLVSECCLTIDFLVQILELRVMIESGRELTTPCHSPCF